MRTWKERDRQSAHGFTLFEVLIAVALMAAISVGVVQLFAIAVSANRAARDRTMAVMLAGAKLEQLRALLWAYDVADDGTSTQLSDSSTNLSVVPETSAGSGLRPGGSIDRNVPPYVDYLDSRGR